MLYINSHNKDVVPELRNDAVNELRAKTREYGILTVPENQHLNLTKRANLFGEEEIIEDLHTCVTMIELCKKRGVNYSLDFNHLRTSNPKALDNHTFHGRFPTGHDTPNTLPVWGDSLDKSGRLALDPDIITYHELETFQRNAVREVLPVTLLHRDWVMDEEAHLVNNSSAGAQRFDFLEDALEKLRRHYRETCNTELETVFIKNADRKELARSFPADAQVIRDNMMDYNTRLGATHLIQPFCSITDEYRFFVVGHTLITGAGRVLSHSSLDNPGTRFATETTHTASTGEPGETTESNTGLINDSYIPFAEKFVADMRAERPDLHAYVLDVAVFNNSQIGTVELNGITNAGSYAANIELLCQALLDDPVKMRFQPLNLL